MDAFHKMQAVENGCNAEKETEAADKDNAAPSCYKRHDDNKETIERWFITLEDPITDPTFGTELGRNDLRIYPLNHCGQTIFFVVECKRLRVTSGSGFKHLADKYVEEGMQRFVDGKYASKLPCGGNAGLCHG